MEGKDNVSTKSSCCAACGYISETHGRRDKYQDGLKVKEIFIIDSDWFLGQEYIFKDRQLRPACTEPATHAFLERATSIPIPKIKMFWEGEEEEVFRKGVGEGERFRIIEERIQGETLEQAWETLSETDREDIAQQTADYLKQLRGLTSSRIEGLHGAALYSAFLFGSLNTPSGPFDTREGFWEALAKILTKEGVPTEAINDLGDSMPPLEPYTFTSAGIHASCVVVKDKKVVGITEWGTTGYLPCWYEYALATIAEPGVDAEWRKILLGKLPTEEYGDGMRWFERFWNLRGEYHVKSLDLEDSKEEAESLESNLGKVAI